MLMYLERGVSFQQMATIVGVNRSKIARRINKLIKVLLDDDYVICIRNRHLLSWSEETVARDYYIGGLSQGKIAKKRDFTVYRVRKCLRRIRWIIRQARQNSSSSTSIGGSNNARV